LPIFVWKREYENFLIVWWSDPTNFDRYHHPKKPLTRRDIHEEIAGLLKKKFHVVATQKQIKNKMDNFQTRFKEAHALANSTGEGDVPRQPSQDLEERVAGKFRYYYRVVDVWSKPLSNQDLPQLSSSSKAVNEEQDLCEDGHISMSEESQEGDPKSATMEADITDNTTRTIRPATRRMDAAKKKKLTGKEQQTVNLLSIIAESMNWPSQDAGSQTETSNLWQVVEREQAQSMERLKLKSAKAQSELLSKKTKLLAMRLQMMKYKDSSRAASSNKASGSNRYRGRRNNTHLESWKQQSKSGKNVDSGGNRDNGSDSGDDLYSMRGSWSGSKQITCGSTTDRAREEEGKAEEDKAEQDKAEENEIKDDGSDDEDRRRWRWR
jgi:hypothetical protein